MIRKKLFLKGIAIFMAVEVIFSAVLPGVSYALTSGPTSPEFNSFEPVDTSEMVNLATGDFVYNLPIVEIGGTAGSYPLSLSYHSGIQTNQDASWVGLGFTLNPGAINRNVNDIADDINGATRHVVDDWVGGSTRYYGIGFGHPGSYAKLTVAKDTYKGTGMGWSVGAGGSFGVGKNIGVNLGVEVSQTPLGDAYGSVSASVGTQGAANVSLHAGVTGNLNTGEVTTSVGAGAKLGSLGVTISHDGNVSQKFGGIDFNQVNREAGKIQTEQSGFSSMFVEARKVRYWSHEESDVAAYGTLHSESNFDPENSTFDSYPVFDDLQSLNKNIETHSIASYPSYDSYNVLAQGLAGQIQPYIFEFGPMYRQNSNDVKYKKFSKSFTKPVNFRFVNDFSNYFQQTEPTLDYSGSGNSFKLNGFNDDESFDYPEEGFSAEEQHLEGSKHIEWFSYLDIITGEAYKKGFIKSEKELSPEFNFGGQSYDLTNQIAGFQITNTSGVTYHYSLPVYAYDEHSRSNLLDERNGATYRQTDNLQPYAYSWLLTGVTGPDYVDRNGNNKIDEGDWGYWVNFSYGKWTSDYQWRNPISGTNIDIEQNLRYAAWGKKEVYYLDAISTAQQTALFSKEIRNDGKGLAVSGLEPQVIPDDDNFPAAALRLNNIYLFNNSDLKMSIDEIRRASDNYDHTFSNLEHHGTEVIDLHDIQNINADQFKFIKRIEFGYDEDYSICGNTLNSYLENYEGGNTGQDVENTGKLSLEKITHYGINDVSLMPPTIFKYSDNNPDYSQNAYDLWGYYKEGVPSSITDENTDRLTTEASAQKTDAWNLNRIVSPLGSEIQIEYESDTYSSPEFYNAPILRIADFQLEDPSTSLISIKLRPDQYEHVKESFENGNTESVGFKILVGHRYIEYDWKVKDFACKPEHHRYDSEYETYATKDNLIPTEVTDGKIYVKSEAVKEFLTVRKEPNGYFFNPPSVTQCPFEDNEILFIDEDPIFVGGLLSVTSDYNYPGGGIRVKEIGIKSWDVNQIHSTTYSYNLIDNPEKTSGVTSYEPYNIGYYQFKKPGNTDYYYDYGDLEFLDRLSDFFNNIHVGIIRFRELLKEERKLLQQSRNIPPPGVIYKNVVMRDKITDLESGAVSILPTYKIFEHSVFEKDRTVKFSKPSGVTDLNNIFRSSIALDGSNYKAFRTRFLVEDYTSGLGLVKNHKVRNSANNDEILYEAKFTYLTDLEDDDELRNSIGLQGQVKQSFYEYKEVNNGYYSENSSISNPDLIHISSIIEYPNALIKQESIDNKSGLKEEITYRKFDLFSASPSEVVTRDSYGNYFLTESIPAYTKYAGMGLKLNGGKHMLSQEGASYRYKLNIDNLNEKVGVVSASATTWSDQVPVMGIEDGNQDNIFRKKAQYVWVGSERETARVDGIYPFENFEQFDSWSNSSAVDQWNKIGEATLYDINSHQLEARDINGNYGSSLIDPSYSRVIASAQNASYYEIAYSGLESGNTAEEGNVSKIDGVVTQARSHTGENSLLVAYNSEGFGYEMSGLKADLSKKYKASVWVYLPGEAETDDEISRAQLYCRIDGEVHEVHPELNKNKSKNWYLLELMVDPKGAEDVYIGCRNETSRSIYFDDFRISPVNASMNSYVYDQFTKRITYVLDQNNFYTKYDYDEMGRLIRISKEALNFDFGDGKESFKADRILKETIYNYGQSN